MIVELVEK